MTLSATYDHLIFDKFTSLRSVTLWITFFYLPFSNWFAFCLSYSMYCFFLFSFFSLWKDFLFVWFTLLFSLLILSHCHYFVSFRFHSMIYLISWLHRAASFWLIHFQFIFNLSFSFLSMTQLLFPIVYVFIVFKGIFCLFSINYWNFQREWIHIDGSVLKRMMSATQLLKAHFIPLTCQQLETTKQFSLLYL